VKHFVLFAIAASGSAAIAATPNPDRPSVSRSGFLVAQNTLEMETGLAFQDRATTVPTTLKYNVAGVVEPRLSADFSGFDNGTPALEAGAKIRILDSTDIGLAAFAASAVPLGSEPWVGTAQALVTLPFDGGLSLQFNGGVLLTPEGLGIPLVGAFGFPITGNFSGFVEVAAVLADGRCPGACASSSEVIDGGLAWGLTEILTVDAGLGYSLSDAQLFGAAGLTANFGTFR